MPPTRDQVEQALRGVIDPELGADIVELGMVRAIDVSEDGSVRATVALTVAGCPLRAQIERDVRLRISRIPGVGAVSVEIGEMEREERALLMERARGIARATAPPTMVPPTARVLVIGSGKGGVGKSTVTTHLAGALARRGFRVGLLDADIWGHSVPRMLGLSGRLGGHDMKIDPIEQSAGDGIIRVVSMGFLVDEEEQALMWRGLVLTRAVEQFLTDVRWGDLDYLLVDMPPGTGDVQMAIARLLPQAEMIVVTTPQVVAGRVAVRVASMARRSHMNIAGVIENMSAFVCEHGERHEIFGSGGGAELAAGLEVPLLGQIPIEAAVRQRADEGLAAESRPGPGGLWATGGSEAMAVFDSIADRVVDEIAPPVEMAGCSARMLSLVAEAVGEPGSAAGS